MNYARVARVSVLDDADARERGRLPRWSHLWHVPQQTTSRIGCRIASSTSHLLAQTVQATRTWRARLDARIVFLLLLSDDGVRLLCVDSPGERCAAAQLSHNSRRRESGEKRCFEALGGARAVYA